MVCRVHPMAASLARCAPTTPVPGRMAFRSAALRIRGMLRIHRLSNVMEHTVLQMQHATLMLFILPINFTGAARRGGNYAPQTQM